MEFKLKVLFCFDHMSIKTMVLTLFFYFLFILQVEQCKYERFKHFKQKNEINLHFLVVFDSFLLLVFF